MLRVRHRFSFTVEDIDFSAGAPPKPKNSETSAEWDKYRDQMERLTAAVKRAMNMPESEEDIMSHDAKKSDEDQAIHISLNGSQQYRLPWSACRTWPVGGPLMKYSIMIATDSSSAWRLSYENGFAKTKSP
jgi:hypothetical protein